MGAACQKHKQTNNNNWWECNHEAPHYVIFSIGDWRQLHNEDLKSEELTGAFVPPSQAAPSSHTLSVWTEFVWLRAGPVAGPCEQSNEA